MAEPGIVVEEPARAPVQPTGGRSAEEIFGKPGLGSSYLEARKNDWTGQRVSAGFWDSVAGFVETLEPAELLLRTGHDPKYEPKEPLTKRWAGYLRTFKPKLPEPQTLPEIGMAAGLEAVGSVPAGIAEWTLGMPFAALHGIYSAKKIAERDQRQAGAYEMGRNAVYEAVARYMMGKAVKRDWGRLTNGLFFGGTASIVDMAEGKQSYEVATNGILNFIMGMLGRNISPRERAQLQAAKEAYARGEGPGALRHLDGIMLQHGPAIEAAAREQPIVVEPLGVGRFGGAVTTPRQPRRRAGRIEAPGVAAERPLPGEPNVTSNFGDYNAFLREQRRAATRNGISLYDMQKMHGIFNAEDFARAKAETQPRPRPTAQGEGFTMREAEPPGGAYDPWSVYSDFYKSYGQYRAAQEKAAELHGVTLRYVQEKSGIFTEADFNSVKTEQRATRAARGQPSGQAPTVPAVVPPGGAGTMPPGRRAMPAGPPGGGLAPVSAEHTAWRRGEASLATSIAKRERADALTRERIDAEENIFRGVNSDERLGMTAAYQQGRAEHIPPQFRDFYTRSEQDFRNQAFAENWEGIWYETRQNYWPSMVAPNQAAQAAQRGRANARSAFFGSAASGKPSFAKAKVFDDFLELRAAGFEPVSTNPAVMKAMRLEIGNMALTRLNAVKAFIEDGIAIPASAYRNLSRTRRALFDGWEQVRVGGLVYHMHPDASKLLRYGLDVDRQSLLRFVGVDEHSALGRAGAGLANAWMTARNLTIPLKLALSAFHARHMLAIQRSQPLAAAMTEAFNRRISFPEFVRRVRDYNEVFAQEHGRRMLQIIKLPVEQLSPTERVYKDLMLAGGFSPMQPSIYQLNAERTLRRVINDELPRVSERLAEGEITKLAAAWQVTALQAKRMLHVWMRGVEHMQGPLFSDWIPMIKAAAYINQAKGLIAARPDLLRGGLKASDELRQELTKLRKSIDNRFGEMQYAKEFWHPTLKFGAFASFLSVGWNLGFVREFGGGLLRDPAKLARLTRAPVTRELHWTPELSMRTAYASTYVLYGLILGGMMTMLFTGRPPQNITDLVYPRMADNERLTTQSFNREFGAAYFHFKEEGALGVFELVLNKMNSLFGSTMEALRGRDYYGRQINDPHADIVTRVAQSMRHIALGASLPISVTAIKDKPITDPAQVSLSVSGFGPAPKYVEKPGIVSAIQHAHRALYPTFVTPWAEIEKRDEIRSAKQHFDKWRKTGSEAERAAYNRELQAYIRKYPLSFGAKGGGLQRMLKTWHAPEGAALFGRLDAASQMAVLSKASPQERTAYLPYARLEVKVRFQQQPTQRRGYSVDEVFGKPQ